MATIFYANDKILYDVKPDNGKDFQLEEVYSLISSEIVQTVDMPNHCIMIMDEEGLPNHKDFNKNATRLFQELYGEIGYIVGDVLVCPAEQFN